MTIVSCAHTHFALSRKQKALLYLTYDTTLLLDITPSTTGNYPPVVKKAKVKKKSQVYYRGTLDTTPLGGYAFQTTQVYIYISSRDRAKVVPAAFGTAHHGKQH